MQKRIVALLLVLVLFIGLAPLSLAAEEESTDIIEEVFEPNTAGFFRQKTEVLLDIIEQYGLYYDGEDYLGIAIVLFLGDHPEFIDTLSKDNYPEFFEQHPELYEEFANTMYLLHDEHSHYMEPVSYETSYVFDEKYVGIGIELDDGRIDALFILNVFADTPAFEAGVLPGDRIIAIDGTDTYDMYYVAASELLRGEEGEDVTITVLRDDEKLDFTMTRREIVLSNINFQSFDGGVAYIRISRFGDEKTFFDFLDIYEDLPYDGYRSVIIDLRYNLGGSTDTAYNILNYILWEPELPMFGMYTRDVSEVYTSLGAGWKPNSIIVLVNESTASAAEIFAGSLWVNGAAVLIGTQTFGKGVGQYHFTLSDDSTAIITSFGIFIGDEEIYYNNVGLEPDIIADYIETPYDVNELAPYTTSRLLQIGMEGDDVLALEQRLQFVGLFEGTPDRKLGKDTLEAMHWFQAAAGLPIVNHVSYNMRFVLDAYISRFDTGSSYYDQAFDIALQLSLETAAESLDYELLPRDFDEYDLMAGE